MKKIAVLACAAVAFLFAGVRPLSPGYSVGDRVANFTLKNVDGKMVSLTDYKNAKGIIVIFDCNTCPYSRAYNDRIIGLNTKYASQGYPVVAINANDATRSPGDSYDEMVKYARSKGYAFPYLYDETQDVAHTFGATNTPHVYVLQNSSGTFTVRYVGTIDDNPFDASAAKKKYVEDAVDALLNGQSVPTQRTKAIGCTIKYRDA